MFNLQPGQGLGTTASRQLAFGLGYSFEVVVGPEPIVQVLPGVGGGHAGLWRPEYKDIKDAEWLARVRKDDEEVIELIQTIILLGILDE